MNVIVYLPNDTSAAAELSRRVAELHADAVIRQIQVQSFSRDDRFRLLQELCEPRK